MASPGNPNAPGGGPFDMNKFFMPSTPPPLQQPPTAVPTSNPNPQSFTNNVSNAITNPNLVSAGFSIPSASVPPPYSYGPQTSQFHYHPVYTPYPNHPPPHQDFATVHPQRSMSYPTPPLQPQLPTSNLPHHNNFQNPPNAQNSSNPGARLMALLSAPPPSLETPQGPQQLTMQMAQLHPTSSSASDSSLPKNTNVLPSGQGVAVSHQSPVMRMPSSKLPKGRHLIGDNLVYDINVRLPGEVQPQLEVTPITKYGSDPGLVLGRQIAVNKTYICYGLKLGAIRVLNINTALRSLLKGLGQRVTDMAFFAEDVHLLASASVDGRVYVWKITEGSDEEDKPQITGKIVIALQITGEGESLHPRVCWHCHKQEVLVVGIGRHVLKIDTIKVGKGEKYSAEEPLRCPIDKLIDGVQFVGSHDGELTDLSMCQWMTTRLVSASVDGTIKIWEDRKSPPIAVLRPHDGQPVNSVTFLAAPHRPDHIILITGGPLNREVKIWVSASEEGWLLRSDAESWHCTQTLELKSSEARLEEAFFNQVAALSEAGLLLLANAKRNAIYVVHLEYGPCPAATRFDYITEFTVTMPILSFTGTSELRPPHDEHIIQVYCVQTQAIQQYALDFLQCLPPPTENVFYEKSDSTVSRDAASIEGLASVEHCSSKPAEISISNRTSKAFMHESGLDNASTGRYAVDAAYGESPIQEFATSSMDSKQVNLSKTANGTDISLATSTPLPLSPRVSRTLSGFSRSSSIEHGPPISDCGSEKIIEYSVDRLMDDIHSNLPNVTSLDGDSRNDDNKFSQDDISAALNHPVKFKHPTHLVTPAEILMASSSSEVNHPIEPQIEGECNIQDVVVSNEPRNVEVEVKVVGETRISQSNYFGSREEFETSVSENKGKNFASQASDPGIEMARECRALSPENYIVEESRQVSGTGETEADTQPSTTVEEGRQDSLNDASGKDGDSSIPLPIQQTAPATKGKKQKGNIAQGSGLSSQSLSEFNYTDSLVEPGVGSTTHAEIGVSQILSMQEMLNQLVSKQNELQKQMAMIALPVTKEGKRLEAALGRSMEKTVKASSDAFWARFQEEYTMREKVEKDRMQQLTNTISSLNRELTAVTEKTLKRELTTMGQSMTRTITPAIEKSISTSIAENFQKGVSEKGVNQLEKAVNSKLEAVAARQIQAQFQTSGKQALQESLKSSLEASVIPSFEMSCRNMFEQVDAAFQRGMVEHTSAIQQQFDASHSPLALSLRDAINSVSSLTQTLNNELIDGQRKLLAIAVSGANSKAPNLLMSQLSNGPLCGLHEKLEVPPDPTKELSRLSAERKYEEAFTAALQMSDVNIVSWLCTQVDLPGILSANPLPLSQGVLLSLLQQLACDISNDTPRKLTWMREVLSAINPTDPMIVVHVRPIFEQVYQILNHQRNLPTTAGTQNSNIRLIMHVINSMLMTSK